MRVGIRCDAGRLTGVGHLVRCVALAEELLARGAEVVFLGALDGSDWIRGQLASRGLPLRPAPDGPDALAALAVRLGLDALVIDSYTTDPRCAAAARDRGVRVLAIVDGDLRGQHADLYLDQNLDAELLPVAVPEGSLRLAGLRYVLLRDLVRARRPEAPRATWNDPVRVLCVFGGTDAAGAAPAAAAALAATGAPFDATVVAARPETARALAALPLRPGQSLTPIAPTDRLPELAAGADLAVSAAGSSTWELLCLGVPTALVCVADNQRLSYAAVLAKGVAVGLGEVTAAPAGMVGEAVAALRRMLTDPAARRATAARGHDLVDGRGRERVAAALLGP